MGNARLAQWRAARTEELTLPSGLVVTVKRVGLLDLVSGGSLPKPLLGMVDGLMAAASAGNNQVEAADLAEMMQLINAAVKAAVVDPPIADVGDEEHLGIDELPAEDKLAVFNWMNAPAAALATFPQQPG